MTYTIISLLGLMILAGAAWAIHDAVIAVGQMICGTRD